MVKIKLFTVKNTVTVENECAKNPNRTIKTPQNYFGKISASLM